jgi:hypothetical protein
MPLSAVQDTYCENTFRVPVWECLFGSAYWEVTLRLRDVVLDSEQDRNLGLSRVLG